MYKFLVGLVLASGLLCHAAPASESPATVLASILAGKGTISAGELERVEAADDRNRLAVLAGILQQRGILNDADLASLEIPKAMTAPEASSLPIVAAGKSSPAPAQNIDIPVVTKKGLPVSLYGTVLFTTGENTATFNYSDVPMIASKQGSDATGGDKNYFASARQTRLGVALDPHEALGGTLSGRFEFDMMGGEAPYPNGINMNLFRMRLGYGRVDWQNVAVEAGQDWSIFAPLNPTSLNEFGIPELTASGNAWIRMPQLRVETHTRKRGANQFAWAFAASDPDMGDYSTTSISVARTPGIGERGRIPSFQSRAAWTSSHNDRDFTIGVSGDYGRGKNTLAIGTFPLHQAVDSWGAAVDWSLPLTKMFSLTGEAYEGRALGIYSVASGESIGAVGTAGGHGVLSRGGWAQAQFNFSKQWQMNLAYGVDNPEASELPIGNRNRNQQYMANIIDRLTRNINGSIEYRRILTDYRNQIFANERGDHIDLGIAYIF